MKKRNISADSSYSMERSFSLEIREYKSADDYLISLSRAWFVGRKAEGSPCSTLPSNSRNPSIAQGNARLSLFRSNLRAWANMFFNVENNRSRDSHHCCGCIAEVRLLDHRGLPSQ